jgi:hypothetical protein
MVDTLSILVTHVLLLIAFWRLAQRRAVDVAPEAPNLERPEPSHRDP